jgi:hypothetical protein
MTLPSLNLPAYASHSEWNQAHPQDAEYDQRLADRAIADGRRPVRTSHCVGFLREWDRDGRYVSLRCDVCGKELLDVVRQSVTVDPDARTQSSQEMPF